VKLPKQIPAKLPLPPAEIARINYHRDMLGNLIAKGNEMALAIHAETMRETEARQAARATAAAQALTETPPPTHRQTKSRPAQTPAPQPTPAAATPAGEAAPGHTPAQRRPTPTKPEIAYLSIIRALDICMRLDAWLAEKLVNGYTSADVAGLYHPARQPILDYLHKANSTYEPFQLQRMMHNDLETRITQELAWAPKRNPGDIIAQIATQYGLAHNPDDYPNNWRPCEFKPPPEPEPYEQDDNPFDLRKAADAFFGGITCELANRGLL
jgi:hypothetical protein